MAKKKSDCILGETQLTEYQPSCAGPIVSLHGQEGGDEPHWPGPTPPRPLLASPVLAGLGGLTYVEFFILCDDFSIGEDGGRRAFGERIS